jgi:REP-associated tyrosine transposase
MPRQPRLDLPGLLQHVIVRGIERSAIFLDDDDRSRFVDRLGSLLVETDTDCYAWALLDNHFHLLLRCKRLELSRFMRRLLTGYAVTFNLRHKRSGHLFQNRYKSIVCEEEPYLLELIRYIHLNPLRAGLVTNLGTLERYPWCGHGVLLGNRSFAGQPVDEVLARFGKRLTAAQNHYREFVADGIAIEKRPELVGGGLRRSRELSGEGLEKGAHDDRVLGSGDFVESLSQEDRLCKRLQPRMSLDALQRRIADLFNLPSGDLQMRGRQNKCSEARALFC